MKEAKQKHKDRPMRSQVSPITKAWREDINRALEVINRGGVILYPTDTIWGLGCDATNEEAVRRIYAIKHREDAKALISLVDSDAKIQFYVRDVPYIAWDLIDISVKPTTIIYDHARNLAPNLLAEDGSAAIRITNEPFSKELCFRMRRALVSTSANISGLPAPRRFDDIPQHILDAVDYVCTSRRNERNNPPASSVIKIGSDCSIKVIRE